ncbi:MAG: hypothetical protein IJH50_10445 [Kiritimatiellae bacterium]|nr:hypothetical protein [Kiritimatiellia bacterium]
MKKACQMLLKSGSRIAIDAKKRDVLFEGKLWRIERHIKSGNRDATLLRVYFDIDRDGNRLVVGSLGDHLPTIGTTKVS